MAIRKVGATRKRRKAAPRRKTTHRRRRRVSGAGDMMGMVEKAGGLILGGVAARELNTLAVKFFPSLGSSPMLSGAIQVLIGYFLPKFVKGPFFAYVGDGMIATGGMVLIVSTGLISGLGAIGDIASYRIGGTPYLRAVGGINGTGNLKAVGSTRIQNTPNAITKSFPTYS